ncbi:unnamed protein product, partial [Didymodactylos carnosus]
MGSSLVHEEVREYLPDFLNSLDKNFENKHYHYDYETKLLSYKLLDENIYQLKFEQVYPLNIDEDNLTKEMLSVLKGYTNSLSNKLYIKTNLNSLTNNDIDWLYTNRLRSL